jgi:phosphatidate cytidylyltransferase
MLRLTSVDGARPLPWIVYGGAVLVVAASGVPHLWPDYPSDCPVGTLGWPLAGLTGAMLAAFVGEMLRYEKPAGLTRDLALAVFGVAYVGLLLSFLVQLRFVDGGASGGVPLISMLVIVKLGDIGAYTVGRLVGRHKMAPRLSPGKTIEGLAGGLAFACGGSCLLFYTVVPWLVADAAAVSLGGVLVYGAVLGLAGVVGDLAESLLKRASGYKDSSAWMPGFGGVLDLLDSPLFAAPVAYVMWTVGIPHG